MSKPKVPLQLRITQRHIDAGLRCHPTRCPVAIAFRAHHSLPKASVVYVRSHSIKWRNGAHTWLLTMPQPLRDQIHLYGQGGMFEPASYTFDGDPKKLKKL